MINKAILKECGKEGFNENELYRAYKTFFGTLSSESRLRIINLLRKGKKNVAEIIADLNKDQTSVSHDLARLKKCGFIVFEHKGKFRYYEVNETTITPIMKMIEKHMSKYCIHILRSMKEERRQHGTAE